MLSYNPYHDPAGDGMELELFDPISAYSLQVHDPIWINTDPHLGSVNHYPDLNPYDWEKNHGYAKDGRHSAAYDRSKHGFGLASVNQVYHHREHEQEQLYQFGLNTAWHGSASASGPGYGHEYGYGYQENARNIRYVSPTDGISLASSTSSDSTFSDYALSPDAARGVALSMSTAFSVADVYSSSLSGYEYEHGYGQGREVFSPVYARRQEYRECEMQMQVPAGVRGSPTACSMKEVQYTPDTEDGLGDADADADADADVDVDADGVMEVEVEVEVDDAEEIKIKAQSPEELDLSDDTSPNDSGLGRSVKTVSLAVSVRGGDEGEGRGQGQGFDDDDDDEDVDVGGEYNMSRGESDDDSDFSPSRHGGGVGVMSGLSSGGGRAQRTSLRSRTLGGMASKSRAGAVQDENARVHKAASGKGKGKKDRPSSRRVNMDSATAAAIVTTATTTTTTTTSSSSKSKSSRNSTSSKATKASKTTKGMKANYPCPFHIFGCTFSFPSKNEWKRHTLSQHLQVDYYRCDLGVCSESHESGLTRSRGWNDFGRKDLFVQHVRRMHGGDIERMIDEVQMEMEGKKGGKTRLKVEVEVEVEVKGKGKGKGKGKRTGEVGKEEFEKCVDIVRQRCWRRRRDGPSWLKCGVVGCGEEFGVRFGDGDGDEEEQERGEGAGAGKAWEDRMEHMARHYERGGAGFEEGVDVGLREWAVGEGVVDETSGVLVGLVVEYVGGGEGGARREGGYVRGTEGVRRARRSAGGGYGLRGVQREDSDGDDDDGDTVEVERGEVGVGAEEDEEEEGDEHEERREGLVVVCEDVAVAEYNDTDTDAEGEDDE